VFAACANHPDREALGVCIRCHRLVCAECVTRIDGINHCARCLEATSEARRSAAPRPTSRASEIASTAMLGAALALSVWVLLLLVIPHA
jgi:hypothetical protein